MNSGVFVTPESERAFDDPHILQIQFARNYIGSLEVDGTPLNCRNNGA